MEGQLLDAQIFETLKYLGESVGWLLALGGSIITAIFVYFSNRKTKKKSVELAKQELVKTTKNNVWRFIHRAAASFGGLYHNTEAFLNGSDGVIIDVLRDIFDEVRDRNTRLQEELLDELPVLDDSYCKRVKTFSEKIIICLGKLRPYIFSNTLGIGPELRKVLEEIESEKDAISKMVIEFKDENRKN